MDDNFIYQMRAYLMVKDALAIIGIAINLADIERLDLKNLISTRLHLKEAKECLELSIINLIKEEKCEK